MSLVPSRLDLPCGCDMFQLLWSFFFNYAKKSNPGRLCGPPLPWDLIVTILSRLPVKSLLRFKALSKSVRYLIQTSHFINFHLNQSTNPRLVFQFYGRYPMQSSTEKAIFSADVDSLTHFRNLDTHFHDQPKTWHDLLESSCNGLVCLIPSETTFLIKRSYSSAHGIVLWNVATKEYHFIENPAIRHRPISRFGFVYVSIVDDYKIVRVDCCGPNRFNFYTCAFHEVRVYSLRADAWSGPLTYPLPNHQVYGFCCARIKMKALVQVGSALHWVVMGSHGCSYQPPVLIMAFDFVKEDLYEVPVPDAFGDDVSPTGNCLILGTLRGCLSGCKFYGPNNTDVWVMKDYMVRESWTRLFRVELPFSSINSGSPNLLGCSKNEGKVLFQHSNNFYRYDLRNKEILRMDYLGLKQRRLSDNAVLCLESLVSIIAYKGVGRK